ncbi:MAG: NAD(P)/FAD-dependent oxidoreductase, partial [Negativicutes bacterium]|nr:NAD(P)/FAD-dependent oxidoreductase [Negativicutes bacterium]
MLRIHNLVVSLTDDRPLSLILKNLTSLPLDEFPQWRVVHRSIDARKKDRITLVYTIDIEAPDREAQLQRMLKKGCQSVILPYEKPFAIQIGSQKLKNRPVIIGMGPAGLFAALHLARQGYRPLIFEKGKSVEKRSLDVANFWNGSEKLLSHSNVQFGEGGAGTFSDGKLTSRSKNPKVAKILADFVKAGAPEDILYHHKPHVGTDVLRKVLINLRKELESLGAEIFFEEECSRFLIQDGMLSGIITSTGREITSDALI